MRDCALRIESGYVLKCGVSFGIGEGVKEGYAAVELFLDCGFAGDGEGDCSELLGRGMVVRFLCVGGSREE